jgi:hypothetical protein
MVSYHISAPKKFGSVWVCEISEYHGGKTVRKSTVKLSDVARFIKAVFHGVMHEDIRKLEEYYES